MAEDVVNITYETLFDILRMEKRREDVQELSRTFYQDVVNYLKQKKEIMVKKEHESGIESFDEIKKLNIQYENVQKIIKEIYERREKKILFMALNKSRTRMNGINMSALLPQEQELYEQMTRLFDAYRKDIAERLMTANLPKEQIAAVISSVGEKSCEKKQISEQVVSIHSIQPPVIEQAAVVQQESVALSEVQVKFLQNTEEFIGPDLESYGPFAAEAVAKIPQAIAEIFVSGGIAQKLQNP
jgi:DNA replication initiation complex subunit (GINS family)